VYGFLLIAMHIAGVERLRERAAAKPSSV